MKAPNSIVIGITGRRQTGKNTTANLIKSQLYVYTNQYIIGFADLIKDDLARLTGGNRETIELNKELLRHLLQRHGEILNERVLDTFQAKLKTLKTPYLLIIPDIRLQSEADYVKRDLGGVILKIERRKLDRFGMYLPLEENPLVDLHRTETEVDQILPDYTIHNEKGLIYLEKVEVFNFIGWLGGITNK